MVQNKCSVEKTNKNSFLFILFAAMIFFILSSQAVLAESILFLHHSVGSDLIERGNVRPALTALGHSFFDHGYNAEGLRLADGRYSGTNFNIPDDNTNPDGFAVIFSQPLTAPPTNAFSHLMQYDVIVFKSCFYANYITSDSMLNDYKSYYRSIRARADAYPGKLFIIVTPPPHAPAETNPVIAARARAFANWLKSDEFLAGHPNIVTFDFFDLLADSSNVLRAGYRSGDSHPNADADRAVAPLFVSFINNAIVTFRSIPHGAPAPEPAPAPPTPAPAPAPTPPAPAPEPAPPAPTPAPTPTAGTGSITVINIFGPSNVADTYVSNIGWTWIPEREANFGGRTVLRLYEDGDNKRYGLLRFTLTSIPADAEIVSASVRFNYAGGLTTLSLHKMTENWVEGSCSAEDGCVPADGATWLTRDGSTPFSSPAGAYDASSVTPCTLSSGTATCNVSALVRQAKSAGQPLALALRTLNEWTEVSIPSSESSPSSNGPSLVVHYRSASSGSAPEPEPEPTPPAPAPPAPEPEPAEPEPEPESFELVNILLDNFEYSFTPWRTETDSVFNKALDTGTYFRCSRFTSRTASFHEGNASLQVGYRISSGGYARCSDDSFFLVQQPYAKGVSFWLKSNRADHDVKVLLSSGTFNSPTLFEANIRTSSDTVADWVYFEIPFTDFVRSARTPAGSPAPESSALDGIDPERIISVGFDVPAPASGRKIGVLQIDELSLLVEDRSSVASAPETVLLADFERSFSLWETAVDSVFVRATNTGTYFKCGRNTANHYESIASLGVGYRISPGGYASCWNTFESVVSEPDATHVSFWLKSNRRGDYVKFALYSGDSAAPTTFEARLKTSRLTVSNWVHVTIPFDSFVKPDWADRPGSVDEIDPLRIIGFGFDIPSLDVGRKAGTVWVDDVKLVISDDESSDDADDEPAPPAPEPAPAPPAPAPVPAPDPAPSPSSRIQPADFVYVGAFRLPRSGSEGYGWEWGGTAAAFYPDGDRRSTDSYPGSLFAAGNAQQHLISEVGIPVPVNSRNLAELNFATTLQPFTDVKSSIFGSDIFTRAGLAYIPAHGAQSEGKLYFSNSVHMGEGDAGPSHIWFSTNLTSPGISGPWSIGGLWHYVTTDYMFDIPQNFADIYVGGKVLATGRFRDGGQGAQGPSIVAIAPWQAGAPPARGTILEAAPLLMYSNAYDDYGLARAMNNYHDSDVWSGGAWLTKDDKAAVIFVGRKGQGSCWYGYADGTIWGSRTHPWIDGPERAGERGWWSTSWDTQIIFYDPADFARVARGELSPWQPQPYAILSIHDKMFNPGTHTIKDLGSVAYDRVHNLLYVFEYLGDSETDRPIVHVWRIN